MPFNCFECGAEGHIGRDCPNKTAIEEDALQALRPRWCGECDQRSRHLELPDGRVTRCQCHPNSHEQLKQHKKCGHCHATVVIWDTAPDCEHHILAGQVQPYVGAPAAPERIPAESAAARQVRESRYEREQIELT